MSNRRMTKIALVVSIVLLAIWFIFGTTSSIAWFKDEDTLVNALYFGDLDISLSYKTSGEYKIVDESTKIFDEDALYEPGFTQIAYLRIENSGSLDFSYDLSVVPDLSSTVIGTSVLGNTINLADYLKFGLIIDSSEEELLKKTQTRDLARTYAYNALSQYSKDGGVLESGKIAYAAIILYLPENVDNAANYRGDKIPQISLGIAAIANQLSN